MKLFLDIKESLTSQNSKPILFEGDIDESTKKRLVKSGYVERILDLFNQQLEELYKIDPRSTRRVNHGQWILLPWSRVLVRILPERAFNELRLNRNRLLISKLEQKHFYEFKVGIAGLSIGNSIVNSLVLHGGGKFIKIIDSDRLESSNLNRVRTSFLETGRLKIEIAANEIYRINPYTNLELWKEKLGTANLDSFFLKPKIDVFIDEVDDFRIKVLLRKFARKIGIPVVMATDSEDSVIVDVERYDLDREYPLFHGRLSKRDIEHICSANFSRRDFISMGKKFIGSKYISARMEKSLNRVGKDLKSVPQLATAALAAGPIVAKVIRDIALSIETTSYRRVVRL